MPPGFLSWAVKMNEGAIPEMKVTGPWSWGRESLLELRHCSVWDA